MTIAAERAHIFVAEDDSCIRELMRELLQEEGYSVTPLREATNAYEEIIEALPDLVILDITLRHSGDGWLTLSKLRHNARTPGVPVIICSADIPALRARQEDLIAMGCVFVEKPFDIDTLLSTVKECLQDKSPVTNLTAEQEVPYSDLRVLTVVPS